MAPAAGERNYLLHVARREGRREEAAHLLPAVTRSVDQVLLIDGMYSCET